MKIICLAVGKKHDQEFSLAIEKYETRLRPYADFRFELIATGEVDSESAAILKKLTPDDKVILLDETGKQMNNRDLADLLTGYRNHSTKRLVIVIGGAYGVSDELKSRSDFVLSLSKLVLPHQLVRLILVEQLYRTYNLIAGGKYHHE